MIFKTNYTDTEHKIKTGGNWKNNKLAQIILTYQNSDLLNKKFLQM